MTASFNEANQLTGSTSNGATSSYGYDGNGNRTTQNENGVTTDFTYQTDNRLTGVTRDGRSSAYAYDGLGRQLNTTETSSLGSQTTKSVWDGTSIVQQSNPASGTSTLLRDAFGEVALQTADGKDASWALLDGLGTTAAQAVGGSVTQLSTFDDWGTQTFDTIGWNSTVNYTGETTDPGYGLNNYYSRTYDPTTGSWMSQDSWRGLLTEPQSLSRYAYVDNGPTSRQDLLGYCYADNSGAYLYGGPCQVKPTPVTSIPSLRVMEAYASDGGQHTMEWEPEVYSYDPDGDLQSIPARHVQGYDDGFPGYQTAEETCEGAGRLRTCASPSAIDYDYALSWYLARGISAKEVMDIFKAHPGEIFPFPVTGCSAFVDGATCNLQALPAPNGDGVVRISTTDTSVTFTVVGEGYFDLPGSTITFQTVTSDEGNVYLRQIANGQTRDLGVGIGFNVGTASAFTWWLQANNLITAIDRYGRGNDA